MNEDMMDDKHREILELKGMLPKPTTGWNTTKETFRDSHVRALEKQVIEYALQRDEARATAAELLVQLKLCLQLVEDESLDELHGDLAECVRAAIAKAEGRQA